MVTSAVRTAIIARMLMRLWKRKKRRKTMAEKEYIGKVAFNYAIREAVKRYPNSFYNGLEVARQIAHDLPAADVRPVQHGVWLKIKYRSICRDCSFRGFASWNYCPNCGRQMATEGENG